MSEMERVIESERERIRSEKSSRKFNKVKRVVGGTVVAGLAALALAVGLRGGSGEYDQATKDSLKASLRPTAVKIARGAIRLSTDWDRYKEGNKMIIHIGDTVPPFDRSYPNYGNQIDIGVVTGMTHGRADPKKVEGVTISRSQKFYRRGSNALNSPSYENSRTVYIDSPQSDSLPDSFFTDGQDYSGHGAWSGSVIDLKGQFAARRGLQANTDNALVASEEIDIFEPEYSARVQTADTVANMAGNLYDRLNDCSTGFDLGCPPHIIKQNIENAE